MGFLCIKKPTNANKLPVLRLRKHMKSQSPYFKIGQHAVGGALAEILSVIEDSALWKQELGEPVPMADLVRALDTTRPAEERIPDIIKISEGLRSKVRIAKWIPWYPDLPEHEYRNQFYDGYRDHTAHTLQVYLLGLYLFERVGSLREPLVSRLQQSVTTTAFSDNSLFLEWWTLASLWHDMGYPFEATAFISDPPTRQRILESLSRALGLDPFADRFNIAITSQIKREIYKAGSYYPFDIVSTAQLLQNARASKAINGMWNRLGVGLSTESPLIELDLITSQDSVHRPPFHDHGLLGASLLAFLGDETESFFTHLTENIFNNERSPL